MSLNGGSYDESLLRSTPAVTREQLQEGYNADLLATPVRSKSAKQPRPIRQVPSGAAPPMPPAPLRSGTASDIEQGTMPGPNPTSSYTALGEKPLEIEKRPFWRTNAGIVAIIIVILVIVAAVVGGAVGGTVNKHSNNRSSHVSNQTTITVLTSMMPVPTLSLNEPGVSSPGVSSESTSSSSTSPHLPFTSVGPHNGDLPLLLNGAFQPVRQAADLPRPTGSF